MNEADIEVAGGVTRPQLRKGLIDNSYINPNRNIAWYGDSRAARGMPNAFSTSVAGFQGYLDALTYCRAEMPVALNFAVSGQTSVQATAYIDDVVAADCGTVIVLVSTNDRGVGITPAQTIAAIDQAVDAFLADGLNVIVIAELPRGGASWPGVGFNSTLLAGHCQVRQHLRGYADRGVNRLFVVDAYPLMADGNSTLGYFNEIYTDDGLHLNETGNLALATLLKPVIEQIYPSRNLQIVTAGELYDATNNPGGSLALNPKFLGTAGALTNGATGVAANNWVLQGITGATVVGSINTNANGKRWQRVTISGTPTDSAGSPAASRFLLYSDRASAPVAAGEILRTTCEVNIVSAGQPYYAVVPQHRMSGAVSTYYYALQESVEVIGKAMTWRGLVRPPNTPVPASPTTLRLAVQFTLIPNQAADLVVDVSDYDCRKV